MAESLLETGTAVIGLAPRKSPLHRLAGQPGVTEVFTEPEPDPMRLKELLESADGPLAVLVDDAEALHQTLVADLLAQIPIEGRGRGQALVVAGTSNELLRLMRGFTFAARQFRCGLLLTPDQPQLGQELFGAKLPRSGTFDSPACRGYLIRSGQAILVQVPKLPADPLARSLEISHHSLGEVPDRLPVIDDLLHGVADADRDDSGDDRTADDADGDGAPAVTSAAPADDADRVFGKPLPRQEGIGRHVAAIFPDWPSRLPQSPF